MIYTETKRNNRKVSHKKKRCSNGSSFNKRKKKCVKNTPGLKNTLVRINNCKKQKQILPINLNNINIHTNNCHNNFNFKLTYTNNNTDINLCNINYINKGSWGSIYKFSDRENKYNVAVKIYKHQSDNEINIIKKLNKQNITCNIINSRLLYFNKKYIGVMDLTNGDLTKMIGKLSITKIVTIVKNIAKDLKCINTVGLSYTDLKCENILIKCDGDSLLTFIGDIGGICDKGKGNICTYTPWEYRFTKGFPICNAKSMVWGLGLILCDLLDENVDDFHWSYIHKLSENRILSMIHDICYNSYLDYHYIDKKKTITVEELLKGMLNLSSNKRWSLSTIINKITV